MKPPIQIEAREHWEDKSMHVCLSIGNIEAHGTSVLECIQKIDQALRTKQATYQRFGGRFRFNSDDADERLAIW